MFTGIVEELGTIKSLDQGGRIFSLRVLAPNVALGLKPGQSLAINGVCLTVVEIEGQQLTLEVMPETLKRTNLALLKAEDKVNLERALKLEAKIDGHFVTGHIDATGIISCLRQEGCDVEMEINCPEGLMRHIALKGSVAVDGVSLTVSRQRKAAFSVSLIPFSLTNTILGVKKEGEAVNIECDILAKYIDKLSASKKQPVTSKITPSFLQEHGFSP